VARRTPQTFQKRQREQKRAEKATRKLAKREARKQGLVSDDMNPADVPLSDTSDEGEAGDGEAVDENVTPSD
jgi:hypothetical protein